MTFLLIASVQRGTSIPDSRYPYPEIMIEEAKAPKPRHSDAMTRG